MIGPAKAAGIRRCDCLHADLHRHGADPRVPAERPFRSGGLTYAAGKPFSTRRWRSCFWPCRLPQARWANRSMSRSPRAWPSWRSPASGLIWRSASAVWSRFGHAAFFGIGGYAAGILASHAFNAEPLLSWPFEFSGSDQMPVIWLVAALVSALAALPHRRNQPADKRRLLHHDHARLRADDLLFRHLLARLWRRRRAVDCGPQRLSGAQHRRCR